VSGRKVSELKALKEMDKKLFEEVKSGQKKSKKALYEINHRERRRKSETKKE